MRAFIPIFFPYQEKITWYHFPQGIELERGSCYTLAAIFSIVFFFLIQNQMHFASSVHMSVSWLEHRWHSDMVRWMVREDIVTARQRVRDTIFTSASNTFPGLMFQSCGLKGERERECRKATLKQSNYLKLSIRRPL